MCFACEKGEVPIQSQEGTPSSSLKKTKSELIQTSVEEYESMTRAYIDQFGDISMYASVTVTRQGEEVHMRSHSNQELVTLLKAKGYIEPVSGRGVYRLSSAGDNAVQSGILEVRRSGLDGNLTLIVPFGIAEYQGYEPIPDSDRAKEIEESGYHSGYAKFILSGVPEWVREASIAQGENQDGLRVRIYGKYGMAGHIRLWPRVVLPTDDSMSLSYDNVGNFSGDVENMYLRLNYSAEYDYDQVGYTWSVFL